MGQDDKEQCAVADDERKGSEEGVIRSRADGAKAGLRGLRGVLAVW
jgi:hypothetical protein